MRTNLVRLMDMFEATVEREGCERPTIRWHFSDDQESSGTTYHDAERGIAVTLGRDHTDAKIVVLHELAHWLTPKEHHGREFWLVAFRLYRTEGIGWAAIHRSECQGYRAVKMAHRTHLELLRDKKISENFGVSVSGLLGEGMIKT